MILPSLSVCDRLTAARIARHRQLAAIVPYGMLLLGCAPSAGTHEHGENPPDATSLCMALLEEAPVSSPADSARYPSARPETDPYPGPSSPIVGPDGRTACFVYRGAARSVHVAGDFNGWDPQRSPMRRVEATDLWLLGAEFEPEARLDYKFVLDGSEWILDPGNPRQMAGGFGANSELAMPGYSEPWEGTFDPNVPRGTLTSYSLESAALGQQRPYRVYTPSGYESDPTRRLPLVLFHDGDDYLRFGSTLTVLDNLIAAGRIEPLLAVFVPPVDRNDEYAFSRVDAYAAFVLDELLPAIDAAFRTETDPSRRAITGPSLGGLITTRLCYARPDTFGLCAPISAAYWPEEGAVMRSVTGGPAKPIRWYLDWGSYEIPMQAGQGTPHPHTPPRMRDLLEQAGYEVHWNEWPEGHSWGSWRAHLDTMLETFFPGAAVSGPGR